MKQISSEVFCSKFLFDLKIKTKFLPSQYNDLPYLLINGFLDQNVCSQINNSIKKNKQSEKAELIENIYNKSFVNEEIRKTNIYKLDNFFNTIYEQNFKYFQRQIECFFNIAITNSSPVQALEYLKGSFYTKHSDDSSMLFKKDKLVGFKPINKQRKLTSILFTTNYDEDLELEDSFNGGELIFNYLFDKYKNNIEFKPIAGQLIVFPSNPFFTHEVKKVIEGRRISLVQWHNF